MIGANRSQAAVESPSLSAAAKLCSQIPVTLQANCSEATDLRIAPSPTKAEVPNEARSLLPRILNVPVALGSRASEPTAPIAVVNAAATGGTRRKTGVAPVMIA